MVPWGDRVEGVDVDEELRMEGEEEGDRAESDRSEKAFKVDRESDDGGIEHIVCPRPPSKEEVNLHNLIHSPYRNWWPVCVKARGKESDASR